MKKQGKKYKFQFSRYIILGLILFLASMQLGWRSQENTDYIAVCVQEGDTIWSLASQVDDAETDIRMIVQDIVKINHLQNNENIYPGQSIKVPVKPTINR